nr:hypothetical protein BaRGS_031606 [Batillaria attramentaria]
MLDSLPSQHLPDICSTIVKASYAEKIQVLDAIDLTERFKKALPLLMRQIEGLKLLRKARNDGKLEIVTRKEMGRPINMRKVFRNLEHVTDDDADERDDDVDDIVDLEKKIKNYLELMLDLPWTKSSKDTLDITQARKDLDADHYGLEKLKKRVLEYLAVRQIKAQLKGPILCFVGPPDIRGHRRTYIGSMPGRIIQGLKTVGTNNPVFLLDEIDKMVILFIATANTMATIPPALLDRMELISVPGYTMEEKVHIIQRHLMSKQLEQHGLTSEQLVIPEDTICLLISKYTREAGVRTLERRVAAICRAVAVKVLEAKSRKKQEQVPQTGEEKKDTSVSSEEVFKTSDKHEEASIMHPPEMPIVIDEAAVEDILGPPMFEPEMRQRLSQPGVVVGLAWTAMGGEILFVEATRMDGEGKLTLTGQLGDVMKESANLALNWVRANAKKLFAKSMKDILDKTDIHIHFPAGAVGGIKEKVLAAHRAGITRVILPARNEKDMHEIPANIKKEMSFILATRVEDVLNAAFEDGLPSLPVPKSDAASKL